MRAGPLGRGSDQKHMSLPVMLQEVHLEDTRFMGIEWSDVRWYTLYKKLCIFTTTTIPRISLREAMPQPIETSLAPVREKKSLLHFIVYVLLVMR